MRTIPIGVILAITVGCTSDLAFDHQSVLEGRTRGVVLEDDSRAQAGMFGNTCTVDVATAGIRADVDVAMSEDHVLDAMPGRVLVHGGDGLSLFEPGRQGFNWSLDGAALPGGDLVTGALSDGGVVGLHADCAVTWVGDLTASTTLYGDDCSGASLSVDRSTGTVFVANEGTVTRATSEGADELVTGDLAAWDSVAGVLYVADIGGDELAAIEPGGGLRWIANVDGDIVTLKTMGASGSAAVSIARGDGSGQVVVIDGLTGEVVATLDTPTPAPELAISGSGQTLALVMPTQSHFFRVRY